MKTRLTQLEFGFNISVPRNAEDIIKESVLMHSLKRHSAVRKFDGKGYLLEFEQTNYVIKIYDKAKQYSLDENILRFEIKFRRAKEFNKLGIYTISDLKNKKNLGALFKYLITRFDELLIVDDYSENFKIPKEDVDRLNAYSSFVYWETITKSNQRTKKYNHKKIYFELLKKHDLLKTRNMLRKQLLQKFEKLINE